MPPNLSGTLSGQFVWLCRRGTGQPLAVRYMYRTKLEEARAYLQRQGGSLYCLLERSCERIARADIGHQMKKPTRGGRLLVPTRMTD